MRALTVLFFLITLSITASAQDPEATEPTDDLFIQNYAGPGGCDNQKDCMDYCMNTAHWKECSEFKQRMQQDPHPKPMMPETSKPSDMNSNGAVNQACKDIEERLKECTEHTCDNIPSQGQDFHCDQPSQEDMH